MGGRDFRPAVDSCLTGHWLKLCPAYEFRPSRKTDFCFSWAATAAGCAAGCAADSAANLGRDSQLAKLDGLGAGLGPAGGAPLGPASAIGPSRFGRGTGGRSWSGLGSAGSPGGVPDNRPTDDFRSGFTFSFLLRNRAPGMSGPAASIWQFGPVTGRCEVPKAKCQFSARGGLCRFCGPFIPWVGGRWSCRELEGGGEAYIVIANV